MKTFSKAFFSIALMAGALFFSQSLMAQQVNVATKKADKLERVSTDKVYKVNATGEVQTIEKAAVEKKACSGQKKACCASKQGSASASHAGGEKKGCCASKAEAGKSCHGKKHGSAMNTNAHKMRNMQVEPAKEGATLAPSGK